MIVKYIKHNRHIKSKGQNSEQIALCNSICFIKIKFLLLSECNSNSHSNMYF